MPPPQNAPRSAAPAVPAAKTPSGPASAPAAVPNPSPVATSGGASKPEAAAGKSVEAPKPALSPAEKEALQIRRDAAAKKAEEEVKKAKVCTFARAHTIVSVPRLGARKCT